MGIQSITKEETIELLDRVLAEGLTIETINAICSARERLEEAAIITGPMTSGVTDLVDPRRGIASNRHEEPAIQKEETDVEAA